MSLRVLRQIDRIDDNGNIREHALNPADETRTVCGLAVHQAQEPAGNRTCQRCEVIVARARAFFSPIP